LLAALLSACAREPNLSADSPQSDEDQSETTLVEVANSDTVSEPETDAGSPVVTQVIGFDADRAFGYLKQICDIGPRIAGSEGMQQQIELIDEHFTKLGAEVFHQEFSGPHPSTGQPVRLTNLIVSWHPEATQRVLLCCHYDTRPYPDREPLPANRTKTFIGANDGASGVALFMEMGHHMSKINAKYGVDFVFFDAEELIYDAERDRDKYFLGSTHFATQYRDRPPNFKYVAGVLVDMIGDKKLKIYYEGNSLEMARDVTRSVWESARKVRAKSFVARKRHTVRDDHLPLNEIARIPTCDLIDFDYPYWHTRSDVPEACSGESLAEVSQVLSQWLTEVPGP